MLGEMKATCAALPQMMLKFGEEINRASSRI
jgi:hypothetical protein